MMYTEIYVYFIHPFVHVTLLYGLRMRDIRSWTGTLLLRAVCQVIVSPENSVLNHIYSDYSRDKVIKKCSRRV